MMEFLFFHGWALDSNFWEPLATELGQPSQAYDRGYFGLPHTPTLPHTPYVIVTHSFGLHLVPGDWFSGASALVIIGGFLSFHPEGRLGKASRRGLQRMLVGLTTERDKTLEQFYSSAASSEDVKWTLPQSAHTELLETDLKALDSCQFDISLISKIDKLVIAQGMEDQVVHPEKCKELAAALPHAKVFTYHKVGHDLGYRFSEKLCLNIQETLL